MTPNNSLSIKDLANALKMGRTDGIEKTEVATTTDAISSERDARRTEKTDEEPGAEGTKDFSDLGDPELFITNVKNWKMAPDTKLMEVDCYIITFFGNLKAITNIPAKKFINYVLAYFLAGNPELEKYMHAKMRANAPSKHFRNL